jgi:hypothetical protein
MSLRRNVMKVVSNTRTWWALRAPRRVLHAIGARVSGVAEPAADWKAPPATDNAISHVEQLALLSDLREAGFLSEDDFASQRRKVLGP